MAPDRRLLDVLVAHGVPFVVIGAHAVTVHGYVRATEDTDVVWLRTRETERLLAAALAELRAEHITDEIDPATGIERTMPVTAAFVRARSLMMVCTSAGFLDLFDHVPGLDGASVAECIAAGVEIEGVRYASLDWLRRMKRAAGRPKDLIDLENLPGDG